jgi:RNAse (barnase) inhibitor barstar
VFKIESKYGFLRRDAIGDAIYFYRYEFGNNYDSIWDNLSTNTRVTFNLAFNYRGAIAINLKLE